MGQQSTGPLGRNAFRAGHSGQVERAMNSSSCVWWSRSADNWPADEALLAAGASVVARAREAVTRRLGFTCSAGVAANKMLAKLCGGLHKPNQQTVLPPVAVADLLDPLPVDRLRGFGGKLGDLLKRGRPELGIAGFESCGALRRMGEAIVAQVLRGDWPHPEERAATACRMAAGRDDSAVEQRPFSKQIGGGKNFSGSRGASRGPLDNYSALEGWVSEFAEDVWARLEEEEEINERIATHIVVHVSVQGCTAGRSKRCKLRPGVAAMSCDAMNMLRRLTSERPSHRLGITGVGLACDHFISASGKAERGALQRMFQKQPDVSEFPQSDPPTIDAATPPAKRLRSVVIDLSQDSPEAWSQTDSRAALSARWPCGACTLLNESRARLCELCRTPREVELPLEPGDQLRNCHTEDNSNVQGSGRSACGKPSQRGGIAALLLKSSACIKQP